jgi:hypothetical protein
MKLNFLLALLFLIIFSRVTLFSQEYNSVEFNKISVNNILLGSKKSDFIKKINKQPDKIKKSENPSGDDWWYNYYYKSSIIEVSPKGTITGFKINDTIFKIKSNLTYFKIGDPLTILSKTFPISYKTYLKDSDGKFRLRFKESDSFILFYIVNNVIVKIETWDEL